ncbi:MAG: PQQ-binding-like beta-propeller repeat protein, partial [Candidatus Eremiobacteraeota bacterium]|nr:PQQ-binding-like beta-propeller repeat protein [Candidatus Eremiobacteraeota bacterium]
MSELGATADIASRARRVTPLVLLLAASCGRGADSRPVDSAGTATRTTRAPVARAPDAGWASYNGTLDGERFAAPAQLTPQNVAGLKPVCQVRLGEKGPLQSGPLVVGDTLFVTTGHTTVAVNAATCALLWRQTHPPKSPDVYPVNRGAAYLAGRLFRGTPDGRLLALDARTGQVLWDVPVGDPHLGGFTSSAPIAWHGLVFIGLAGGDWGIRGRVMGFDAATGKERWRFYTVPMGKEPGARSWHRPATAARGGGATWTSYTLDTAAAELFVPVGNPAPDFAPQARPGDNLYTNAVVVLDANSGALKWHYQLIANDGLDYDLGAAPMLYNAGLVPSGGGQRVALGSKDGHVYAVDRASHQRLFKTAVTTVSAPPTPPTRKGVHACPGPLGGVEWNGPAYDPRTKLIYAGAVDWCGTYTTATKEALARHKPGMLYYGGSYTPAPGDTASGWLTALDAQTGQVQWQFHAPQPIVAGVTPTAGGLVFTGDLAGTFYAFDAASGKALFTYPTRGAIAGGVITYATGGEQYVATTSGNISRTTFRTAGSPTVIVFGLNPPAEPRITT